jgi:tetratricopeptide (TPR) repeat protein
MPKRSPETVAAVKNATQRVQHGFELAERGALYAAQAEFTAGLKLIAQAYDLQEGTRRYTKSLAAGLTALKEARDFLRQSDSLREVDIASLILPHSTPVLKDSDTKDISPIDAAQCYFSYAQEQLSAASGQEMTGSMALYAMGKVSALVAKSSGLHMEHRSQAIALYRASLISEPRNFRAANELGVLLAENGQLELARDLLIRSVTVSPQVTTWKNLAVVHTRAGDRNLAEQAREQARVLSKGKEPSNAPAVQWVDAATFASTTSAGDSMPPAITKQPTPAVAGKQSTPAAAEKQPKPSVNVAKSLSDLLRISPRR